MGVATSCLRKVQLGLLQNPVHQPGCAFWGAWRRWWGICKSLAGMPALQPFCPAGLHPLLPDPAGHHCTLVGFSVGEPLAREPPLDICLSLVESEAEARKLEYSHSRRCRDASSNHPLSENYLRTSRAICTKTGQGRASKGKGFQTRQFRIETLVSQIKAGAWLRMAAQPMVGALLWRLGAWLQMQPPFSPP